MATISSRITIKDNASKTLEKINRGVEKVLSNMIALDVVSDRALASTTQFEGAQAIFNSMNASLDRMAQSMAQVAENTNKSDESQEKLNDSISRGTQNADGFSRMLGKIAATYLTLKSAKDLVELSDSLVMGGQKIQMAIDQNGLDVSLKEVQDKILHSANYARVSYTDMMNQVGKLAINAGQRFGSMDEVVAFAEQFHKLAVLGGASVYESSQSMYQLTQSMAKGRLDGDELRSVMEGMPLVAKAVADYMETDVGTMKEMAREGAVTADVVRNALLGSITETNEKIDTLGYTWQQLFTILKNGAIGVADDLLSDINRLANNNNMDKVMRSIGKVIAFVGAGVSLLIDGIDLAIDNFDKLAPVIALITALLGTYLAVSTAIHVAHAVGTAATTAHTIALALFGNAASKAAVAQMGLNAAILASPITWITLGIMAAVVAIIALINHFTKAQYKAQTVIGAIVGGFYVLGAAVKNTGLFIGNVFSGIWSVITTVFKNAQIAGLNFIYTIEGAFWDLLATISAIVATAVELIAKIPGVQFDNDSFLVKGVEDLAKKSADAYAKRQGYESLEDAWAQGSSRFNAFPENWAENAYRVGAWKGDHLFANGLDAFTPESVGAIESSLSDIAADTNAISGKVDISTEEIKWLRDIAEKDAINKYTTVPLTVNFSNTNNVNNDYDLDGITDFIAEKLVDTVNGCAEVVHY